MLKLLWQKFRNQVNIPLDSTRDAVFSYVATKKPCWTDENPTGQKVKQVGQIIAENVEPGKSAGTVGE